MSKNIRKLLMICLAVIILTVPSQVMAIEKINLNEPVSLTITTAMPAVEDVTPSSITTVLRLLQSANALLSIFLTPSGIVMLERLVQPLNAS